MLRYKMSVDSLTAQVIAETKEWLERAVIGLNLCPFAKSVYVKNQVHYRVSLQSSDTDNLDILEEELFALTQIDAEKRNTTLLILPNSHEDFWMFDAMKKAANSRLKALKLSGILQIAHFHPRFEFMDEPSGDITHFTNRSPYPTVHLLHEASITEATKGDMDEAQRIVQRNKATLCALGEDGWNSLNLHIKAFSQEPNPS